MSPEVALLVRVTLLGLLVFAIERFGRRRQARRAATHDLITQSTIIRLPVARYPETPPLVGRPVQVDVKETSVKLPSEDPAGPTQPDIVRLEPRTTPAYVTEKRAA